MESNTTVAVLTIKNLKGSDSGNYTLIAHTNYKEERVTIMLIVTGKWFKLCV